MDMDKEITEHNGEIYFTQKAVLVIMISTYLFPEIDEYNAYLTCKRKTEYLALILATKKYGKNKGEILQEIKSIKTKVALQEYIDRIDKFISYENLIDILCY